jgi:hypothetical protein
MSVKEASFEIRYDGPSLTNNRIPIRDLAPALLGVSDLVEEADYILNEGNTQVTALVSPFKNECFGIEFTAIQQYIQSTLAGFYPILDVLKMLGFTPKDGLLWLLVLLKGRRIINIEKRNRTSSELSLDDGEKIADVPHKLADLAQSKVVRKAVDSIIAQPLSRDGIMNISIYNSNISINKPVMNIYKEDKDSFRAFPEQPYQEQRIEDKLLKVVGPVFGEDYKWRLADGSVKSYYDIQDHDFLKRVESRNIQFAAGDMLKVRLCTNIKYAEGIEKESYEVQKVLEVIRPPKPPTQLSIEGKSDTKI